MFAAPAPDFSGTSCISPVNFEELGVDVQDCCVVPRVEDCGNEEVDFEPDEDKVGCGKHEVVCGRQEVVCGRHEIGCGRQEVDCGKGAEGCAIKEEDWTVVEGVALTFC